MPTGVHRCLTFGLLVAMATAELVHVSVLFRHGHRSPVNLLPSENFTVENTWKDGLGQLTNIGKRSEFELGQFLRKRYDSLLGSRYNSSLHYVRSTDMDRTLMSAQACLAGLFPPTGDQQWNRELLWQPIPVHTRPQSSDLLLASPEFPCPERDRQFARMRTDPRRLAMYAPHESFLRRLGNGSGMPVTPDNVHSVLDTLWIDTVAGLPPPAWLNTSSGSADWRQLVTIGSYQWQEYSWTPDLIRFGSGVLLDEILDTLSRASRGQPPVSGGGSGRKLRMYSDHDTTVASMLAALGNRDFVWPNFASCLMVELHRSGGSTAAAGPSSGHWVRVWFRNDSSQQPRAIQLASCSMPDCPLERALELLAPMRMSPQRLNSSCVGGGGGGGGGGFFDFWSSRVALAVLCGLLLLACCLLASMAACRCYRERQRSAVVYRSLSDVEG